MKEKPPQTSMVRAQNSTVTARKVPGRPFPKGVSGNPGGKPKSAVLRALLIPHRRSMVATLLHLMRSADRDATRLDAVKTMLSFIDVRADLVAPTDLSIDELLAIVMRIKERGQDDERLSA